MLKKTIAALLLSSTAIASAGQLNSQGGFFNGETGNARLDRLAAEIQDTATRSDRLKTIELVLVRELQNGIHSVADPETGLIEETNIESATKAVATSARVARLTRECLLGDTARKGVIAENARGGGQYAWLSHEQYTVVVNACLPIERGFGLDDENGDEHDTPVYFDRRIHTYDDENPAWNIRLTFEDANWHTTSDGTPCTDFDTVTEVKSCIDPTGVRHATWRRADRAADGSVTWENADGTSGVAFQGRAYEAPRSTFLSGNCLIENGYMDDGQVDATERAACTYDSITNQPVN